MRVCLCVCVFYDLLPTGKSNDACMCASEASSSASGLRWTPRMVADVEVVVVHLLLADVIDLALVAVPALACNIFQ